jgi:hypothetical protein
LTTPTTRPTNRDTLCSPTVGSPLSNLVVRLVPSSTCSSGHFKLFFFTFALVARSTASNSAALDQCDSTPPLLYQISDNGPSTLSSTLAVWSERLFSLLDPNGADPPKGRLRAFANDLHLAFVARQHTARPSHKWRWPHSDSGLLKRADSQRVIKCKVQSSGRDGDDGSKPTSTTLPGMTPTDSNGRPLPTQTVSEGHGGGGRETIAVTQPCGNIPVGASSKESSITCNTIADGLSQLMCKRRRVPMVNKLG